MMRGRTGARRMRDRAEAAARERTDAARRQLGERAIDAVAEQFPRAFRARRRNDVAMGILAGLVAGVLVRELLGDR